MNIFFNLQIKLSYLFNKNRVCIYWYIYDYFSVRSLLFVFGQTIWYVYAVKLILAVLQCEILYIITIKLEFDDNPGCLRKYQLTYYYTFADDIGVDIFKRNYFESIAILMYCLFIQCRASLPYRNYGESTQETTLQLVSYDCQLEASHDQMSIYCQNRARLRILFRNELITSFIDFE